MTSLKRAPHFPTEVPFAPVPAENFREFWLFLMVNNLGDLIWFGKTDTFGTKKTGKNKEAKKLQRIYTLPYSLV